MFSPITGLYWPDNIPRPSIITLRPICMEVIIDPITADRVFLLRFDNHAPLAIRQTPEEVMHTKLLLMRAEAAALH